MPTYRITMSRGQKSAIFTVDAPDEQTAQREAEASAAQHPALMSDEERQQKIAALEQERTLYEGGEARPTNLLGKVATSLAGAIPGMSQEAANKAGTIAETTGTTAAGGIAQSLLGVPEAAADVAAMQGPEHTFGRAGEAVGDWIRKFKGKIDEGVIGLNKKSYEAVMGRPMLKEEEDEFRQAQYELIDRAEFGADIGVAISAGGLLKGAKTIKSAVGLGILDGAVSTYLLADSEGATAEERSADRLGEAAVGAVFGGLGSGLLVGVPAAVKNGYGRYIMRQIERAGGIDKYLADAELAGGRLSIGAWTGNVDLLLAEANARGITGQEAMAAVKEELIRNIAKAHGYELPPTGKLGEGLTDQVSAFVDGLEKAFRQANNSANASFRARLSGAEELWGGVLFKPTDDAFVEPLTRILKELDEPGMKAVSPDVRRLLDDMARSVDEGVTVKQLNTWQVKLNELLGNKGDGFFDLPENVGQGTLKDANKVGNAYAAQLKEGFHKALAVADPVNSQAAKAMSEVQRARSIYGRRMNALNKMEHEVLTALGVYGKNANEVASKLIDADPRQVRAAAAILRRMPGGDEALSQLRGAVIHNAAFQSTRNAAKTAGSRTGDFNLGDFLDNYAATSVRAVELGLMSPAERAIGQQAVRVARDIMNAGMAVDAGVVRTHAALSLSNIAINAASRDPGFIARLVGATIEHGKGADWLFHTPNGIKVLITLRDVTVGGKVGPAAQAAANAATVALLDIVGENVWQKSLEQDEEMERSQ